MHQRGDTNKGHRRGVSKQIATARKVAWLRGEAEIAACFSDNLRRGICNSKRSKDPHNQFLKIEKQFIYYFYESSVLKSIRLWVL